MCLRNEKPKVFQRDFFHGTSGLVRPEPSEEGLGPGIDPGRLAPVEARDGGVSTPEVSMTAMITLFMSC